MADPLCPATKDGRHQKRPWQDGKRSGVACRCCHKTWEWKGDKEVPTHD